MKRYGKKELLNALANGAIIRDNDWYCADAGYRVMIDDCVAGYIVGDLFSDLLRSGAIVRCGYGYNYRDYSAPVAETETAPAAPAATNDNDSFYVDGVSSADEYRERENEFMQRTDALCENKPAYECDCSACPCRELCEYLHKYDPNNKPVTTRKHYVAVIVDAYSAEDRVVYFDAINDDHARKIASAHCDVCERVESIEKI